MPTVSSLDIIRTMLQNDGVYPGDPQMYAIATYVNTQNGERCYHISITGPSEIWDANLSPFVSQFEILWVREQGLTEDGVNFLRWAH